MNLSSLFSLSGSCLSLRPVFTLSLISSSAPWLWALGFSAPCCQLLHTGCIHEAWCGLPVTAGSSGAGMHPSLQQQSLLPRSFSKSWICLWVCLCLFKTVPLYTFYSASFSLDRNVLKIWNSTSPIKRLFYALLQNS